MKRFVGVVAALILLPAGTATAQQGAPDLDVKENPALVKADGPGFKVKLSKHDLKVQIDDDRFGIPEAGFDIERSQQDFGPIGQNLRPFVCENGTYRIVSGIFDITERSSSTELRPLPYPPAFGNAFPTIITFVGTLDAVDNIVDEGTCHQTATLLGQTGRDGLRAVLRAPVPDDRDQALAAGSTTPYS